jgi:hypothetical protein
MRRIDTEGAYCNYTHAGLDKFPTVHDPIFAVADNSMNFLTSISSSMPLHWWVALIISALGIAAICLRAFETEDSRTRRAERTKKKELRSLAEKISSYGRTVHQRYPSGDVIVSQLDLAEQLRKRPDAVATALNLLLNEQKVQRATLSGYWKLNVRSPSVAID